MSEPFKPGPGWREAPLDSHVFGKRHIYEFDEDANAVRKWVRVVPVPPLPTEPYTVIRVTWSEPEPGHFVHPVFMLIADDWCNAHGEELDLERVSGFEVLSEPRAVTAKAMLDRLVDVLTASEREMLAAEFGVES